MSNVFNAKRFGNYLIHDIKSAWRDSGILLIICTFAPVVIFILGIAFQLVFKGDVGSLSGAWKIMAIMVSALILAWVFPAKHYGPVTEKRYGSSWLMLPASTLEKYLSVLLLTCLVLPVCFFGVQFIIDKVLSFIPAYGNSAYGSINDALVKVWDEIRDQSGMGISMSIPYAVYLSFASNILTFTLGAIFFKNSKIGKTFVALIIIEIIFSLVLGILTASNIGNLSQLQDIKGEQVMKFMNVCAYVSTFITFAVLDVLIYLRIKTLKH